MIASSCVLSLSKYRGEITATVKRLARMQRSISCRKLALAGKVALVDRHGIAVRLERGEQLVWQTAVSRPPCR